jgi:hypothetical protein
MSMGLSAPNHINTSLQSVHYIICRSEGDTYITLTPSQKQHYYGISSITDLTFFDTPSVTRAMI